MTQTVADVWIARTSLVLSICPTSLRVKADSRLKHSRSTLGKNGDSRQDTLRKRYFGLATTTVVLRLGLGFHSTCRFSLERQLAEET